METSQDVPHHMDHSDDEDHKCCDSDDSDSQSECESMMHCGFSNATISPLPVSLKFSAGWVTDYSQELSSGVMHPSHSAPPFRPPIA